MKVIQPDVPAKTRPFSKVQVCQIFTTNERATCFWMRVEQSVGLSGDSFNAIEVINGNRRWCEDSNGVYLRADAEIHIGPVTT